MDNWGQPQIKGTFRESDGTPSHSRTASFLALAAAIVWVSVSLGIHKQIPDLIGPAEWVSSITLCMYGVNQAAHAIGARSQKNGDGPDKS